jgi:hypothetical protein
VFIKEINMDTKTVLDALNDTGDSKLVLAAAILDVAKAIHKLGTADAATPMGAIELLAKEVKGISSVLQDIHENSANG